MLFYHYRWIGNAIIPLVALAALFGWWLRSKPRPAPLTGAVIGEGIVVLSVAVLHIYALWFRNPAGGWIPPSMVFIWLSAYPVQLPAIWVLGEDNFVEEHLLVASAILSWVTVGTAIGWLVARIGERTKPSHASRRS